VVDWSVQRHWEDVVEGEALPTAFFPLSVYRLVAEAGANKDFSSIHHNTEWAQSTGAPEMYANNVFLQGMWEKVIREYIGLDGMIRQIGPFRMKAFNTAGETVIVTGTVQRKWIDNDDHFVELAMSSAIRRGESAAGTVTVTLPSRNGRAG
jgi:hypothetical protein